tara:strand:- start:4262 stop:5827 length:1566 start_codon:yes stop_codon:yes gene_type:complete
MESLVEAFCETYLVDNHKRPLRLRPLQLEIITKSLTFPNGDPTKQRKMAVLAPRGSGKSWALSVAVIVYMFFKRFRDMVFVIAPTEDQASLIFNYVLRHFQDNAFLSSLVDNYKLHNKPHIKLKGGTMLRRSPIAPTNQGQAIRGQHPTFLVVDESPLIADSLFVDNVEPSIIANKAPFINLGTPKTKENHMHRYLYDENYADSFTRLHYTWRDAIDKGAAYSPPYDEEEMLTKMLEWGEDSLYWRTEYECEFVESVSNVFTTKQIRGCFDDYELTTLEAIANGEEPGSNNCVAIDIGKSVNSTVISVWRTEKADIGNITRLIYLEEISPKSGGHDIPYQRRRIMEVAKIFNAVRVILDATGIGGAFETEIRAECIPLSIHFLPFIFTGGAKGSKTLIYRDMVSFIQQGAVRIPNPDALPPEQAKLVWKWYREHIEIEYVMDAANKTEKIAAPNGKHDDYCDSSAMGIHASLSMLPGESSFTSVTLSKGSPRRFGTPAHSFATTRMGAKSMKNIKNLPRGI